MKLVPIIIVAALLFSACVPAHRIAGTTADRWRELQQETLEREARDYYRHENQERRAK